MSTYILVTFTYILAIIYQLTANLPSRMPRPRPTSSAVRAPLDFMLGTQGSVRALRVLATTSIPLSQSELGRRASVSPSAIPALLASLEGAGVIAYEGRGRTRQVQLHRRHPLVSMLVQLFQEEQNRWLRIQTQLREMVGTIAPDIICAWIEGPVTVRQDRFVDPLVVGTLSETPLSIAAQEILRKQTNGVQSSQHVMVALRFYQRADLLRFTAARRAALQRAIVLYGPTPIDIMDGAMRHRPSAKGVPSTRAPHSAGKARASVQAFAARIANRLVKEPEIVASARAHIDRRLPLAGDVERLALLEWQGLLDSLTVGQIAALLRETSERADVLRQNTPFLGALGDDERAELLTSD